ncbi:hypothetical protein [Candidatus Mesenet endosymbiont of Agriotes lineatus]|uniref:hypothetical protein n=1 Tax=Candidatus Mesenet endosymbiont of Agriotes lineatus TaxID=3077948 RepID=UPI0030CD4306
MLRVVDIDEVINIVREKDIIEKNYGTVEINYGQIKENYGTVIINRGEIEKNCKGAIVKQNLGKVELNSGSIIRDYTNGNTKINQKISSVIVEEGIKYGIERHD